MAGRTTLTDRLALKVRQKVEEGYKIKDVQKILGINPNTWDTWFYKDTKGFRKLVNDARKRQFIIKAERNLGELLDEKKDKKVKADMTKFTLERLNREEYGKEPVSILGKEIQFIIPDAIAKKHHLEEATTVDVEE